MRILRTLIIVSLFSFTLGSLALADSVPLTEIDDDYSKEIVPGDYRRYIEVDDHSRFYDIHVPPTYSKSKSPPLILAFHGGGGNPESLRSTSTLDSLSNKEGFIVVYPAGYNRVFSNGLLTWNTLICCGASVKRNIDDVKFTSEILTDLYKLIPYDRKRVYSTGISNGALMSYLLASKLPDKIAAIAPVAAQISTKLYSPPKRPVPILHFHGRLDRNAAFLGGIGPNAVTENNWEPVIPAVESWGEAYGCEGNLQVASSKGKADYMTFDSCPKNAEVEAWIIRDGGHTSPGGIERRAQRFFKLGLTSQDVSAAEEMWKFFQRYHLP